jgi:outer membrane lipase/esterase
MKARVGLAALATYLALSIGPASAYTALFAFGDSLSDAGNLYDLEEMPAAPYVDGHFSNGPTWVEDLSKDLGLGTLKPSYSGGTDFAVGGATTGNALPIDLNYQVSNFEGYAALAHLTPATLSGALFTLDIGANDILNALPEALADPSAVETTVVNDAKSAAAEVEELYADGARTLLYYEVPELGLTPEIQALGTQAETAADMLAQLFNATLLSQLAPLETGAGSLKVFDLDTYDLLGDIVADPTGYGFSNVSDACIDTPACVSALPAVQDTYLFWDGVHPTEGGHTLAAGLAYALVAPEPSTWAMMLVGFAGLSFASWRAHRARMA